MPYMKKAGHKVTTFWNVVLSDVLLVVHAVICDPTLHVTYVWYWAAPIHPYACTRQGESRPCKSGTGPKSLAQGTLIPINTNVQPWAAYLRYQGTDPMGSNIPSIS